MKILILAATAAIAVIATPAMAKGKSPTKLLVTDYISVMAGFFDPNGGGYGGCTKRCRDFNRLGGGYGGFGKIRK